MISDQESPLLRHQIHHWKCDRPIAFHGTSGQHDYEYFAPMVKELLQDYFESEPELQRGPGQGNHVTFLAECDGVPLFVRVDDSPERDVYLRVESHVQKQVHKLGVRTPVVFHVDTGRAKHPIAWQMMELVPHPDLNQHYKDHTLNTESIARQIGTSIARWQNLKVSGFGPFNPSILEETGKLVGFHEQYADYFFLHLERHLQWLAKSQFLSFDETVRIEHEILSHSKLLDLRHGCLVHKDLALWNILGTPDEAAAFIDWDDAIMGDPMDDLSLLACFHGPEIVIPALEAYRQHHLLPLDYQRRFWLHLLRNMISKAVIRVGSGYFDLGESFFLVQSSHDLKKFTHQRIFEALEGLSRDLPLTTLTSPIQP